MRFALLMLVALAYPLTMVQPPTCQGGGCATYSNGHCVYEYNFSCGTVKNPGKCTSTLIDEVSDTWRCSCGPLEVNGVPIPPINGKKR